MLWLISPSTIPLLLSQYLARVAPIIERHYGRYLVRGGTVTPITGNWHPQCVLIIKFPTKEDLVQCFSCEEYKAIVPIRDRASTGSIVMVEGYRQPV